MIFVDVSYRKVAILGKKMAFLMSRARSQQGGHRLPLLQLCFALCGAAEAPISAQNLG